MADQLAFDWPTGVALGPEDFFVSVANAQAFAMLTAPETWPEGKLVITGPAGCGKSHLARIFASQQDALLLHAAEMPADMPRDAHAVVIEDIDHLPRDAEETVFHLHNDLRSRRGFLLMTAQTPPSRWPIALPDLVSRMQATTVAPIAGPDDALLAALIMKLFADRQITPKAGLVDYLVKRIDRSFAAAAAIVADLDRAALARGQKIGIKLASDLLDNQT